MRGCPEPPRARIPARATAARAASLPTPQPCRVGSAPSLGHPVPPATCPCVHPRPGSPCSRGDSIVGWCFSFSTRGLSARQPPAPPAPPAATPRSHVQPVPCVHLCVTEYTPRRTSVPTVSPLCPRSGPCTSRGAGWHYCRAGPPVGCPCGWALVTPCWGAGLAGRGLGPGGSMGPAGGSGVVPGLRPGGQRRRGQCPGPAARPAAAPRAAHLCPTAGSVLCLAPTPPAPTPGTPLAPTSGIYPQRPPVTRPLGPLRPIPLCPSQSPVTPQPSPAHPTLSLVPPCPTAPLPTSAPRAPLSVRACAWGCLCGDGGVRGGCVVCVVMEGLFTGGCTSVCTHVCVGMSLCPCVLVFLCPCARGRVCFLSLGGGNQWSVAWGGGILRGPPQAAPQGAGSPSSPPKRCPYLRARPLHCPGDPRPCGRGTLSILPPCPPPPRVPWDPRAMGQHSPPSPPPASPQAEVPVEGLGSCCRVQGVTPVAQHHGAVGPAAPGRCQ